MASMISYLLTFLSIMFWFFRLIVAYCFSMEIDIGFEPLNMWVEIALLFASVPCIILMIRRNLLGTFIYAFMYWMYFGSDLIMIINSILQGTFTFSMTSTAVAAIVGVGIPVFNLFDVYLNKNRAGKFGDKKTDWFYKNKDYDRQFDERADKNNYKF